MNQGSFTKKQLNVLIYNPDLPYFPGASMHEFLNTTHLAQFVNQIGLVSMVHNQCDLDHAKVFQNYPIDLYLWTSPSIKKPSGDSNTTNKKLRFYKSLLKSLHRFIFKNIGYIVRLYTDKPNDLFDSDKLFRHMSKPLTDALSDTYWDAIIIIQSSSAKIIDYVPRTMTTILVMHDIRSLMYERQKNAAKNFFSKIYYGLQEKRIFHFEKKYCQKFDLVITLSTHDEQWVRNHYSPKKTTIVPIPVDLQYFQPNPIKTEQANRIVFTGHMSHPPNIDAATFFAKKIFPKIRKSIKDAEFYIVGKSPKTTVMNLARIPGIKVTGTVADTRPYLSMASVVVVPLRFGSGVRNKILEAWGMNKYTISTTIGAEGLSYTKDTHLKIADDAETFAKEIIYALRNPEERTKISLNGRNIAMTEHSPYAIGQKYFQEINLVTQEKINKKKQMRIAIDLRWMIPGKAGGIEQAARAFINELSKLNSNNRYLLLLNPRCDFDLRTNHNMTTIITKKSATLTKHVHLLIGKLYSKLRIEHINTPTILNLKYASDLDVDLVYSFSGYIYHDLYSLPNILTVHDIQHEYFPEFFSEDHLLERKRIFGESINIAKHITAISEYTRQTLIDKLRVNPDKITTIYQAADPYFSITKSATDSIFLKKYKLKEKSYLFFPAHTWFHKNHIAALKALSILKNKHKLTPKLICSGGLREAQPYLKRAIKELSLENQVEFLGYLPRPAIPALYRSAIALIYPSLFEGFGMPVLEAMNSGCPVICSNTTSLPEIAGNAALFIHPYDYEGIADAIYSVMNHADIQKSLVSKGLQQAQKFSWENHARTTTALFQKIYNELRT